MLAIFMSISFGLFHLLRPLSPGVCAILDRVDQLALAGAGPPSGRAYQ
jgi:hypothetical protein